MRNVRISILAFLFAGLLFIIIDLIFYYYNYKEFSYFELLKVIKVVISGAIVYTLILLIIKAIKKKS